MLINSTVDADRVFGGIKKVVPNFVTNILAGLPQLHFVKAA
jgi:hypothetical protein